MEIRFDKNLINRKFRFLLDRKWDRKMTIMKGGSSSSKTYSISQCIPMWILQGHNIIIARESGNTLRRSIWADVEKAIINQGLQKYFSVKVSYLTIDSKVSNGSAVFIATSDEEKLKSITPKRASAFDICIMEEASEISFASQQQLQLRMRGRTNFDMKRTYMLLNPISRNHIIYKKYYEPLDNPDNTGYLTDDIHLHHSTYKDNAYLEESEIEVLEGMKEISPRHYEVYALGMWGTMTKTVYSNWESKEIDFEDISELPVRIGVDWGFVHPMAVTFCAYDELNSIYYIFDEIRCVETDIPDLGEMINAKIDEYGIYGTPIYCDTSEPRNRNILRNMGLNAMPAYKKVNEGIEWFRRQKIIIDKKKCFYTTAEMSNYSWKEDKAGEPIDEVIKENDDLCDSFRYSGTEWTKESAGSFWGDRRKAFAV